MTCAEERDRWRWRGWWTSVGIDRKERGEETRVWYRKKLTGKAEVGGRNIKISKLGKRSVSNGGNNDTKAGMCGENRS